MAGLPHNLQHLMSSLGADQEPPPGGLVSFLLAMGATPGSPLPPPAVPAPWPAVAAPQHPAPPSPSPDALLSAMLQAGGLGQQGGEPRGAGAGRGGSGQGGASWPAGPDPREFQAAQNAAQLQQSVMMLTQLVQVLLVALQNSLAAAPAPALAPQERTRGVTQAPPAPPAVPDLGQLLALMPLVGPPVGGPLPFAAGLGAAPDFLGGGQAVARGATSGRWGGMHLWRTTRDVLAQAGPQGMSIRQIAQQLQQSYSPGEQVNVGSLRNTLCQRRDIFRRLGGGIWTLVGMTGATDDVAGLAAPGRGGRPRAGAGSGRRSARKGGIGDDVDGNGNGEEAARWGPVDDGDGAAAAAVPQGLDGPSAAAAGRRRRAAAPKSGGRRQRQRLALCDVDEGGGGEEPQRNGNGGDNAHPATEAPDGDELP